MPRHRVGRRRARLAATLCAPLLPMPRAASIGNIDGSPGSDGFVHRQRSAMSTDMNTGHPSSSTPNDRRQGLDDRRMLEREPASDRRLAGPHDSHHMTSEDVQFRPPVQAGDADPPTEDTQLLFERS
jgi:hypothetical protein